jgi:hypothetical protein
MLVLDARRVGIEIIESVGQYAVRHHAVFRGVGDKENNSSRSFVVERLIAADRFLRSRLSRSSHFRDRLAKMLAVPTHTILQQEYPAVAAHDDPCLR